MRVIAISLFTVAAAFAQSATPDSSGYAYEERPGIGLYYEFGGTPKNISEEYTIWKQPFDLSVKNTPFLGVGAHLPLYSWFGINGVVGMQQLTFNYKLRGDETLHQMMKDSLGLTDKDLGGTMKSRNLLVQAGFETGIPFYTNYQHQVMCKALVYGSGILGKTFFDDSKFANANIWGYAYGGGLRIAWGPVALEGGVRLSHIYWRTYFDPENQTGDQAMDDTFLFDYDTPISPYVKAVWGLY